MAQKSDMYVYDGTNFVPWGGTVTSSSSGGGTVAVSGGTVQASNFPTTVDTNSGAKSASTLRTVHATDDTMVGALTESAPGTDTASSGLNGRLQRLAQNITTLIASTLTTKEKRATTGTKSSVAGSASSVTVLASNANRLGGSVFNESASILYLDLSGGTSSATSYSVQLTQGSYFEIPFAYTGAITGIWATATGNARVTEYT